MLRLLVRWLVSALALIIVAHLVPGFYVDSFWSALKAALVLGIINATLGVVLKFITLPLTILTLGLFWLVINAILIELTAWLVRGFDVTGFLPAFIGAIVLAIVNVALRWLIDPKRD